MKPIRTLIIPVIISAFAITGVSAAQARAEVSDLGKFLIGAAAIAAIAAANKNKSEPNTAAQTNQLSYGNNNDRWNDDRWNDDRWQRQRGKSYALPAKCLDIVQTRRGDRRVMNAHCIKKNTRNLAKLPKACRLGIQTRKGRKWAYSPRCLKRAGFQIVNPRRHNHAGSGLSPNWQHNHDNSPSYSGSRAGSHIVWGD